MPLDQPHYLREQELPLATATLTSFACQNALYAVDDDPATAAVFLTVPQSPVTVSVPGTSPTWTDTGITLLPGMGLTVAASGACLLVSPYWALPEGAYPPSYPPSHAYQPSQVTQSWPLDGTAPLVCPNLTRFCLALAVTSSGVPPADGSFRAGMQPNRGATYPPGTLPPGRVYAIFNDFVGYFGDNGGAFTVTLTPISPCPRFLRADWGGDTLVSRVRVNLSVPAGASSDASIGIALESSLGFAEQGSVGTPPDYPLAAYLPLSEDGITHDLVLDPPVLARGVTVYPDYLSPATGLYPTVNFNQLQVYEPSGATIMPNPTPQTKIVNVSLQAITLYPYDNTGALVAGNAIPLAGLESATAEIDAKWAEERGGETQFLIAAYPVQSDLKIKWKYAEADIRLFQAALGGTTIVDAANGNGPETQYQALSINDRMPYFRMVAKQTIGTGSYLLIVPKIALDKIPLFMGERDKVTFRDAEATAMLDPFWVRQDGQQISTLAEALFAPGTANPALHS